uniref:Protein ABHD18 n=2 Tax=Cacopsylla melanoneura TaxID=428564 RepID=A0A8D8ZUF8_9HEMI
MTINRIDQLYRSILLSKYFVKGWGKPEDFKQLFEFRKRVCRRETCYKLVSKDFPVNIDKKEETNEYKLLEGHFISPFGQYLPDLVPDESKKAYFQVLIPKAWETDKSNYRPMVIHMAGTGDHYFWRRRNLIAKPLLKESNIGSIILENPFYGHRKPAKQVASILHNVSDIFVMGGCLMLEALVLFHWCEREGFGPLGVTGLSMGGHMASLAATNWPKPLVLVPCLSWSTASGVFTEGVLSGAIPWDLLEDQYRREHTFKDEIEKMMTLIDGDAYRAGEHFARTYPSSLISMGENISPPSTPTPTTPATPSPNVDLMTSQERHNLLASIHNKLGLLTEWTSGNTDLNVKTREGFHFMRGIMNQCTHLANFDTPVDTSLIISVCAKDDGYVPQEGVMDLRDIWPGCEVRYIDGGHVLAFVLHQKDFRNAIRDAFNRARVKLSQKRQMKEETMKPPVNEARSLEEAV